VHKNIKKIKKKRKGSLSAPHLCFVL